MVCGFLVSKLNSFIQYQGSVAQRCICACQWTEFSGQLDDWPTEADTYLTGRSKDSDSWPPAQAEGQDW